MEYQHLFVYKLEHSRLVEDGDEKVYDTKILGFFSSTEVLKEAIEFYKTLEGFRDYSKEFAYEKCEIDSCDIKFE